jgi:adenosylcobyric acid synthase
VIVLPGTKSTLLDLQWLHREGWVTMIHRCLERGTRLIGICGGHQMLGNRVLDPNHYESCVDEVRGLGVFDSVTTMHSVKRTLLVEGVLEAPFPGIPVQGYEIHMGMTTFHTAHRPFARVRTQCENEEVMEGCVSENGLVIGTYLHGIFHNDVFRTTWLNQIRSERGLVPRTVVQPIQQLRAGIRSTRRNSACEYKNGECTRHVTRIVRRYRDNYFDGTWL